MKQYTYKRLQELTREIKKKMEARTAEQKEMLLAAAAAHALDFLNLAKDNHLSLDLTLGTEGNVDPTLLRLHLLNTTRGMTAEDSRMNILKKLGGYELFTIYNGIAEAGSRIQFDIEDNQIVLCYENADGSIVSFDVYGELEKVLKDFKLSSKGEDFYLFGSLRPFYNTLTEQFLKKLQ